MLLAGSLSFIGVGIMAAVLPMLFTERGSQMTHVIQAVLLLVSGVYYPVDVLPDWMQPVARLSPATYVLEGMRQSLLDGAPTAALLGFILPLVVTGVAGHPPGHGRLRLGRALRQAHRRAQSAADSYPLYPRAIDTILRLQRPIRLLTKPPACDRIVPVQLLQLWEAGMELQLDPTVACLSTPNWWTG